MEKENNKLSFFSALPYLLFLTGIFFLTFIARLLPAPLMPAMAKELSISPGIAGILFLMISIGYAITLFFSGIISFKINHHYTIALSAISVGVALIIIGLMPSIWTLGMGMLFMGMAAGPYLPSGIVTITHMVKEPDWGKGLAIHELAPNLSFVVAPLLAELFLKYISWRRGMELTGIFAIIVGIIYARYGKGTRSRGSLPTFSALRNLAVKREFWLLIVLFGLGIGASLGSFTMLPLYLVTEKGMLREWVNPLIAMSRISSLGTAFLSGWISDKMGPGKALGWMFISTSIFTALLGILPYPFLLFPIFIQPALTVCFFPPAFALLSRLTPPHLRNLAVSLTIPTAILIGGGGIPSMLGFFGDIGLFSWGFIVLGAMLLGARLLLFWIKGK